MNVVVSLIQLAGGKKPLSICPALEYSPVSGVERFRRFTDSPRKEQFVDGILCHRIPVIFCFAQRGKGE
ncbi:hypothetical protein [Stenotrophomonas maltophilia]|uniref:hypothetical protein n=1 Tax=Stenotrophomonas maltophilia TaxID=40324 RepID=UPI0015DFA3D7|nr:hypothetical protein [Stenotrophomonas maltophilia]